MVVRIEVEGLVKRYRRFELRIDHLTFENGITTIIGPNGSGKTVLLRTILGLTRPNSGRITVEVNGKSVDRRNILSHASAVLTDIELPNWTVRELIRYYLGLRPGEEKAIVEEYMLEELAERRYDGLSSGYKRRVQVAIALSMETPILVLDEPFINVDSRFMSLLEAKLLEMRDRLIIVVTHILSRLLRERIVALEAGRVIFDGRIPTIIEDLITVRSGRTSRPLKETLAQCGLYDAEASVEIIHDYIRRVAEAT